MRSFLLAACAAALLAACAGKPPVLSRVMGRVIYVRDGPNLARETLGVYLVASDPDGMENLSAFYVIADDAQLFWKVDRSAWVTATAEGETWIGTASLSMPGADPIPPGEYRVVLQDSGGATVEDHFTLAARSLTAGQAAYPTATLTGGLVRVSGVRGAVELWTYDKGGNFAGSFPATTSTPVTVASIRSSAPGLAGGFTLRAFAWNTSEGYGVLSAPVSVAEP